MDVRVSTLPRGLAVLLAGLLLVGCVAGSYALIRGYFPIRQHGLPAALEGCGVVLARGREPHDERIGVESQRHLHAPAAGGRRSTPVRLPVLRHLLRHALVPFSYSHPAAAIFAELMLLGLFAALAMTLTWCAGCRPRRSWACWCCYGPRLPSFRGLLLGQPALLARRACGRAVGGRAGTMRPPVSCWPFPPSSRRRAS